MADQTTSTDSMPRIDRRWNDLPADILSIIAEKLDIIGLLHFKSVCKTWNSSTSTATAAVECSRGREPWFLVYGDNSVCTLVGPSRQKYDANFPELVGSTCVASRDGWLLLLNESSVSFFCPFSRVKLDLPNLPNWEFPNIVATFTSSPTSPHCVVAILLQREEEDIQLYLIRRGEKDWSKHTITKNGRNVIGAAYYDNTLYFPETKSGLLKFYLDKVTYGRFTIVHNRDPSLPKLPFCLGETYFSEKNMKEKLGLDGDVCVKTCGTSMKMEDFNKVVFYESVGDDIDRPESKLIKGVWIHPRFFQVGTHFNW